MAFGPFASKAVGPAPNVALGYSRKGEISMLRAHAHFPASDWDRAQAIANFGLAVWGLQEDGYDSRTVAQRVAGFCPAVNYDYASVLMDWVSGKA